MKSKERQSKGQVLKALFLFSMLLQLLPLLLYGGARFSGAIPTEKVWDSFGGNHGPWCGEIQGMVITLAFFLQIILLLVSVVAVPIVALAERRLKILFTGLLLLGSQIALVWFTTGAYIWTVD